MQISKIKALGVVLVALQASFAPAAGPMCSRAFDPDDYTWLERDTPEKNAWVQHQTGLVNSFVKPSANRPLLEKFLTNYFSTANTMAVATRKDPATGVEWSVKIVDRGLGRGKPVDVEIERNGEKKTLLSSYDFKRNNSVIPTDLSLSPDGALLLVKTSTHGSLDSFTGTLIELATGRRLQTLSNMDSGDAVWVSKNELHYDEAGLNGAGHRVVIEKGAATVADRLNTPNFRGSDDHQYAFAVLPEKRLLMVRSTITGKTFTMPAVSVKSIFHSTDGEIWIHSRGRAGFGMIVRVQFSDAGKDLRVEKAEIVVPEIERVVDSAAVLNGFLITNTFLGGDRTIGISDLQGREVAKIQAPGCCQLSLMDFSSKDGVATVMMNSPARRKVKWFYDLKSQKWAVDDQGARRAADPMTEMMSDGGVEFVTSYHSYKSKDGTEIPVRITHRKDIAFNGQAPTLLEGYGGFGLNNYFHPEYNPVRLEFLRAGGVHVAPALRGSTFFGEPWHDDGRALNKQHVIDDFIGAAEWAIAQKITTPKKLAISGASHGGLLVGASLVQRPDLFGLAFPQFGPHDFSRKPFLDPVTTPSQVPEYGDLFKDPAAQANAVRISPFLNAVPGKYPMTVVITGQQDSRVNPDHSFRFAAHLQDSQRGDAPIFMYALKNSGHWMMSEDRQDTIGWRANVTYWTVMFDYFGLQMRP